MKSPYVGTLVPNETVTASFLVLSKDIRQKRTGEPYLTLHLSDRTGDIEAKMWDNVAEVMHTFDRDDFVKVKGLVQVYQNRHQFTVHRLRRLQDHEVDFGDYFPCSERDPEEMGRELQAILDGIQNPHLHELLQAIFADSEIIRRYKIAPAAKSIHHACRGGLLEHVLSLCQLCRLVAGHYKDIDLDLLLAGALLHDIGKIEELSYQRSFGYSTSGQLLGHIVIGLRIVGDKAGQIPNFPPKLRTLLEHMILSHHGELEFGSPKLPLFEEALLLHHLDNLDSKIETMRNALKREAPIEGEFTGWIGPLERAALRKSRYLSDKPAEQPAVTVAAPAPARDHSPPTAATEPEAVLPERPRPPETAPPDRPPATETRRPERPPQNTLFGEKLQAVLGSRSNS
jgi:3'-5' exoribonuclease